MPQPAQSDSDLDRAFDRLLDVLLLAKLLVEHHPEKVSHGRRFDCLPVYNHLTMKLLASFPSDASQFGYLGCKARPSSTGHASNAGNVFRLNIGYVLIGCVPHASESSHR
mgnify:FL=1|jgi:hypothetical protein